MKRRCFSAGWSLLLGGLLSAAPLYGGDTMAQTPPFSLVCRGIEPGQLEIHLFADEDLKPVYAEIYRTAPFCRYGTFRTLKTRRLVKDWKQYEGTNRYDESFVLTVPPAGAQDEPGHLKALILMRETQQQIMCESWKRIVPETSFY